MLKALGQPARLQIVRLPAAAGPDGLTAATLANTVGLAPNALSAHMQVLKRAGLAYGERCGRSVIYRHDAATLQSCATAIRGMQEPDAQVGIW